MAFKRKQFVRVFYPQPLFWLMMTPELNCELMCFTSTSTGFMFTSVGERWLETPIRYSSEVLVFLVIFLFYLVLSQIGTTHY